MEDSASENFRDPVVLFGNQLYIYDGHNRVMLSRMKKIDLYAYIVTSQKEFEALPEKYWDGELTPEKYSYNDELEIMERSALSDDEVFN